MSTTFPISRFFKCFLLFLLFSRFSFVYSIRSSSSNSAESTGSTGSASSPQASASSLVPTSSHLHRGDRELISAQFRAVQDGRDLDTSESSVSVAGLDSLSAAAAAAAVGLEDDPLALSKYMAASASAYPPSKIARLNRYTQTGFYDPYPTYAAASLNSIPSSYYPYNAYSSYRDANPMLDTYPYYERDRIRELRERALQAAQSAPYSASASSSSSNRDGYGGGAGGFYNGVGVRGEGYRSTDMDNQAMSSGHGHEEHGHGWGWGMYTSKVNTNAIGLLGLLGLLSLLSNVLMQFTTTTTTTTTMAMGRRKRSAEDTLESRESKRERIFMEILPHLTPVAHAKDGVIPLECTFHGVCMANRVLVNEFGIHGRAGGMRISSAIVKLLEKTNSTVGVKNSKPSDKASKYSYTGKKQTDIRKKLESAGLDGRNKKDCEKSYPVCNALQSQKLPNFPFIIRMQDLPMLISKANKMAQQGDGVPMKL